MTTAAVAALAAYVVTDDWLIAASVFVLGAIWTVLHANEGPPVLALAMTLQWIQVTIGLFYLQLTGRTLQALLSDYRPMVAIGLGTLSVLVAGLWCGQRAIDRLGAPQGARPADTVSLTALLACYGIAVAGGGVVQQLAWNYPGLTQAILTLTYVHLALLYLVLRRFARAGQWYLMAPLLGFEIALGFTGFYDFVTR